jgi:2-keto-4-pentenoate hydratase
VRAEDRSAEELAAGLVAARRGQRTLTGFPGPVPVDMATAYRIQDAAIARWSGTLAGWKIGYVAADRRRPGDPDRLVGPIWQEQLRHGTSGTEVEVSVFAEGFAAVEAELVVRLGQDLPTAPAGGWTAAAAATVEHELLIGIEVASSPIPDINGLGPTVIAADFGNNNGLVLGPVLTVPDGPGSVELACVVDGQRVGRGSGANLPGGLYDGLATAWNLLAARDQRLRGGMVFATGAITGIHPIAPGQQCRVEVPGGPAVELRTAGG